MYCKNCGKQISVDSKFCQYCGIKLDEIINDKNEISEFKSFNENKDLLKENSQLNEETGPWGGFAKASLPISIVSASFSTVLVMAQSMIGLETFIIFLSFISLAFGIMGVFSKKHKGKAITSISLSSISIFFIFMIVILEVVNSSIW